MDGHHPLIVMLLEAAEMANQKEDYRLAESLYKSALRQARGVYGEYDALTGEILMELAEYYEDKGRAAEAEETLREYLQIIKSTRQMKQVI